MVQVDSLSKSYGDRNLFTEVSFSIGRRERCAIAGRNGSGKSTLLKILAGWEEADSGSIHYPKGLRIGSLPQHLSFTHPTLLDEAASALPKEERDMVYKVEILLSGLGFSEADFAKPPNSFSGGYQLRLALVKVLAGEPDLLLLDEPTNYLDILSIRWLENFLKRWHGQIVFISHDRTFVNRLCTHIIGIKRGNVMKIKGNLQQFDEMVEIREETHERSRQKIEKKKKHMMTYVEKYSAKATKAKQAQSRLKAIAKMDTLEKLQEEENLAFAFNYFRIHSKVLLHAHDLHFAFNRPLIHHLKFEIGNGERLAIIGKNGSGKSTILRLLTGELQPDKGRVTIQDNTSIAYFGQTNIDRLNSSHTIEEELVSCFPHAAYAHIRSICGVMMFSGDDVKKKISILSGGERSRVLLAKILLTPSNLLLLDEPTHHLDLESVYALIAAIRHFPGSVALVTHDEDVLRRLQPHKLIICHDSEQEFYLGDYDQFLEDKGWLEER